MPSYTKITSKLHKISNISSAVGISHVKNCTIPLKGVSEDFQIILSPIIEYKAETVVRPTKVNASSTSSKSNIAQEFTGSKTGRYNDMDNRINKSQYKWFINDYIIGTGIILKKNRNYVHIDKMLVLF